MKPLVVAVLFGALYCKKAKSGTWWSSFFCQFYLIARPPSLQGSLTFFAIANLSSSQGPFDQRKRK